MYIRKLFAQKSCVFSIEFFPPKQVLNWPKLQQALQQVKELNPDFVSITCSAGGTGFGGVTTCQVAAYVKNELDMEPLAHLTCVGSDTEGIDANLDQLFVSGVRNLMILRGDLIPCVETDRAFDHASDLARYVRGHFGAFGLHGACYPEKHPEAESLLADVEALKWKQESGITHLITQMFFDNLYFYRFMNLIRKQGIDMPVSAGIMPIVRRSQIDRTLSLSNASVPPTFRRMVERWQDDPQSLYSAGIDYAVLQLRDLIRAGADGVHIYAMNNGDVAQQIYRGIQDLL